MIIPPLHGNLKQNGFFIYAACDEKYFDEFGKSFINSVLKNTTVGVHVHIFNPREDQLSFCNNSPRVSVSFENIADEVFVPIADKWKVVPSNTVERLKLTKTLTAMSKSNDQSILERMKKTYFACARFIRLDQLTEHNKNFFAMDIDAIVRKNIIQLPNDKDCYLHHITEGTDPRILAGGIMMTSQQKGFDFIKEYSDTLFKNIVNDYLYWGIDQDVLKEITPKYKIGNLPDHLIDWKMRPTSSVWTAKGQRKELLIFINEQRKYNS
jgi:hypothetical protein